MMLRNGQLSETKASADSAEGKPSWSKLGSQDVGSAGSSVQTEGSREELMPVSTELRDRSREACSKSCTQAQTMYWKRLPR